MLRIACLLSVTGLLALVPDVSAKPKGASKGGDRIEMLFKKLDTNHDGKLTKEEFAKMSEMMHKKGGDTQGKGKGGGKADQLFSKLDADGDGKVTLEEFKKLSELKNKKGK
jgi:Ca2+-binding EF-hand superfamily protein